MAGMARRVHTPSEPVAKYCFMLEFVISQRHARRGGENGQAGRKYLRFFARVPANCQRIFTGYLFQLPSKSRLPRAVLIVISQSETMLTRTSFSVEKSTGSHFARSRRGIFSLRQSSAWVSRRNSMLRHPDMRGKLASRSLGDGSSSRPNSRDGRLGEASPPSRVESSLFLILSFSPGEVRMSDASGHVVSHFPDGVAKVAGHHAPQGGRDGEIPAFLIRRYCPNRFRCGKTTSCQLLPTIKSSRTRRGPRG